MSTNASSATKRGSTSLDRIQQALRQHYRLAAGDASDHRWREAIACEVLRNTIWSLCVRHGNSTESKVNLNAVTRLAKSTIRLVSDPAIASLEHMELLAECFQQLKLLGDIESVGRAVVAPVASRLVHMWGDSYLLVGGMSSPEVERRTKVEVRRSGASRWLTLSREQVQSHAAFLPEQSFASWSQRTPVVLADHHQRMLALPRNNTLDPAIQDTCVAYAPDLSSSQSLAAWSQRKRWRAISMIRGTRVSLIEFRPPNSGVIHAIGLIEGGRIINMSEPHADARTGRSDAVRLFQFAEDQMANHPFCIKKINDTTIGLGSSLPQPETRLLHTLAHRMRDERGREYPQRWSFEDSNVLTFWIAQLQWIGIRVRNQEPNQ